MISDARVEVTCDECDDEVIEIDLEYVYTSYNGNSGNYSLRRVEKDLNDSNWTVDEDDDEKHYCEFCSQERNNKPKSPRRNLGVFFVSKINI